MDDELLPRRVVHSPFVGDLVVRNFHGEDINWPLGGPLIRFQKIVFVVVRQSDLADMFILDWI